MVANPVCCRPDTDLAAATALLRNHDCGALPVVDHENRPAGMITDRDICIAVGTQNKPASEILIRQVMSGKVFACAVDAKIHEALAAMKTHRVRRLIITNSAGQIEGILSVDDLILNVQWSETRQTDLSFLDVIRVLKKVTYPSQPCAAWLRRVAES